MAKKPAGRKTTCAAAMAMYAVLMCAAWVFPAFAGNTNIVVDH